MGQVTNSVESRLASALGRRDEQPNIQLAEDLARSGNSDSVQELVAILASGKGPAKSDAIKVLYEVGQRDPSLIVDHTDPLLGLLEARNNRLVWGALTALAHICQIAPDRIFTHLEAILAAADKGSVIAKDQAFAILIILAGRERYADRVIPIILSWLNSAAINQLPMYAEQAARAMPAESRSAFRTVLESRLNDEMRPSKRKRIETVLRRLG
ncbi:MAG: hypothetical protein AAFX92_00595 [Pseudomonadota bacterium]